MEELFQKYYTSLCYYSYRLCRDREMAEDIVQNVFVRYWETSRGEAPILHSRAWLYTAARNATLNEMGKQQTYSRVKERVSDVYGRGDENEKDAGMLLIESETARQLWGRVNELPRQCRQIIHLYFIEGLSNMEIAERLQLHVSTIKTQKQRGIDYLRKAVKINPVLFNIFFIKIFFY